MTPIGPRCRLGECPLWDHRLDRLYLIDIDGQAIHRIEPESNTFESRLLPGRPGSMVLSGDPDRVVVALEHQLVELSWSTQAITPLVALEPEGPGKRLNDGRCDPAGRYWVGSMDDPHDALIGAGKLYRVDPEPNPVVSEHRGGIYVSNGMAFSPDGLVMYWADSPRGVVWRYDINPTTGDRSNEQVFLDFGQGLPGAPDGACVDEDGCYWVACVNGSAVLRATPDGRVDRIVDLPVAMPTMPAFGGAGLDTLFVTSIADGISTPADDGPIVGGQTLALDVGIGGLPEPVFEG